MGLVLESAARLLTSVIDESLNLDPERVRLQALITAVMVDDGILPIASTQELKAKDSKAHPVV
jgi:hypothetical protein